MKSLTESEQKLVNWLKSEFKNRNELAKYKFSLYNRLRINYAYLLDLALPSQSFRYTLNDCKKEALKYKTRTEWATHDPNTYQAARTRGWISECCQHMSTLRNSRTLEECKKEALKYKTKGEWYKKHYSTYSKALRNGWLEECCQHMISLRKFRTLGECKKDAMKYKKRGHWKRGKGSKYYTALRNGWLEECCQHMEKPTTAKK